MKTIMNIKSFFILLSLLFYGCVPPKVYKKTHIPQNTNITQSKEQKKVNNVDEGDSDEGNSEEGNSDEDNLDEGNTNKDEFDIGDFPEGGPEPITRELTDES